MVFGLVRHTFAEQQYVVWNRYAMWDAEKDDDAAFERRLDNVVREIGERGKLIRSFTGRR